MHVNCVTVCACMYVHACACACACACVCMCQDFKNISNNYKTIATMYILVAIVL